MSFATRSLLAAVLALAAWAPSAASAAGRGITAQEMAALLQEQGYKAKVEVDDDGDPMVRTRMGGVGVTVFFYDCNDQRCGSLQFQTGLDLEKGTTPAVTNRFNREYRYASAYLDEENDPFLQFDFEVLHTQHTEHVVSQIDVWEELLGEFLRATGYHGDGDDDDGAQRG